MKEKIKVVVNPVSAHGRTKANWYEIKRIFEQEGLCFDWEYTSHIGHSIEITKRSLKEGYSTIIAIGGDGTINEVFNGFFENGKLFNEKAKFAILSSGSGGDFVKTLDLTKNAKSFVRKILEGKTIYVDGGLAQYIDCFGIKHERYFINVADVGIGGETCQRVNQEGKNLGGFLAFLNGTLSTILEYQNKDFTVKLDNEEFYTGKANTVVVANGMYFGGGMKIAPSAKINDSYFDVIILGNLNKFELVTNLYRVYKGTHLKHSKVFYKQAKKIDILPSPKGIMEIDGEPVETTFVTFKMIPKAVQIVI